MVIAGPRKSKKKLPQLKKPWIVDSRKVIEFHPKPYPEIMRNTAVTR